MAPADPVQPDRDDVQQPCGRPRAINGHIGFDKLEITDETALDSHACAHYPHHKYFEVNSGADGLVPLDKWLGYWHEGSKEADERMKARANARKVGMPAE